MVYRILLGLRWSARISGLLLVGLVLVFMVGEGVPNVFGNRCRSRSNFLGIFLMLGFLLGWRWEALGGGLAVGGFAMFFVTELIVHRRPPGGALPLFAVPGVLLLLSYAAGKVWKKSSMDHPR